MALISSKIIELSGAPSGGVGQTYNPGTMQSSLTMMRWKGKLGRISWSEKVSSQMITERNNAMYVRIYVCIISIITLNSESPPLTLNDFQLIKQQGLINGPI